MLILVLAQVSRKVNKILIRALGLFFLRKFSGKICGGLLFPAFEGISDELIYLERIYKISFRNEFDGSDDLDEYEALEWMK